MRSKGISSDLYQWTIQYHGRIYISPWLYPSTTRNSRKGERKNPRNRKELNRNGLRKSWRSRKGSRKNYQTPRVGPTTSLRKPRGTGAGSRETGKTRGTIEPSRINSPSPASRREGRKNSPYTRRESQRGGNYRKKRIGKSNRKLDSNTTGSEKWGRKGEGIKHRGGGQEGSSGEPRGKQIGHCVEGDY